MPWEAVGEPTPKKRPESYVGLGLVLVVGVIVVALVLSELTGGDVAPSSDQAPPAAVIDDSEVDWENHAPSVKTRIDALAAARDCAGLQLEFDTAEANSDAQYERTGDNNADLMGYIDARMAAAGC